MSGSVWVKPVENGYLVEQLSPPRQWIWDTPTEAADCIESILREREVAKTENEEEG